MGFNLDAPAVLDLTILGTDVAGAHALAPQPVTPSGHAPQLGSSGINASIYVPQDS